MVLLETKNFRVIYDANRGDSNRYVIVSKATGNEEVAGDQYSAAVYTAAAMETTLIESFAQIQKIDAGVLDAPQFDFDFDTEGMSPN